MRAGILVGSQTDRQAECRTEEDYYPKYEDTKSDAEFLPKRQPGSFPNLSANIDWQVSPLTRNPQEDRKWLQTLPTIDYSRRSQRRIDCCVLTNTDCGD
jgi:hypothetical protein